MEQSFISDMPEKIGCVEVFSEQGIRLLLLNIDEPPPTGPGEHSMRVGLSDERARELSVRFSNPWPTVHVTYSDPALKVEALVESDIDGEPASSAEPLSTSSPSELSKRNPFKTAISKAKRWLADRRFWIRPGTVNGGVAVLIIAVAVVMGLRPASA